MTIISTYLAVIFMVILFGMVFGITIYRAIRGDIEFKKIGKEWDELYEDETV